MKADAVSLLHLLSGTQQFIIPIFQRDYSWTEAQCQQLLDDIVRVGSASPGATHFVGSLVYVASADTTAVLPQWMVIDGQQRLTTCTLLLAAVRDRLRELGIAVPPQDSPDALDDQFLQNRYAPTPALRSKVSLRGDDNVCLQAVLFNGELPQANGSRVLANRAFFVEQLKEREPILVLEGLRRLMVVSVSLTSGFDNPQMIFESLNSTGLSLTQADLVRNYVLMGHAEPVQTGWYEQYWRPLEKAFGVHYRESFDSFLRDFLVLELRTSKPARLDRVYREFRQWYPAVIEPKEAADKLAKLLRFGRYYCQFSFGANERPLEEPFRRLRQLIEVASPVVMALAECHDYHRTLTLQDFVEAVETLESYVFRRSVVGAQTRNLSAIFGGLAHRVKPERPLGSLKAALARQGKSREFPDNEAFRTGLLSQDIYGRRTCFYLLERLTNAGREKVQTSNLTVEHVLPQNPKLSPEWQAMLGADWKGIQARCLHKLGNLTLTAFNTEFSDRPFAEKKAKQPGGYANSPVWLNSSIATQDAWGEKEIAERGGLLADRALTIWKPLQVSVGDLTQAELDEAKERSSGYTVDGMPWDEQNRALFDDLRQAVLSLDPAVVELPYAKSVVYRAPDWFVEVLPRAKHLTLRLAPEPDEMASISAKIEAADSWSFIINSVVDGGTLFEVWSKKDVEIGKQLITRAFELASE